MKKLLWLDDWRNPFENDWLVFSPIGRIDVDVHWVKSYTEFVCWIASNGLPDAICFDNSLGDFKNNKERTGYDCAKWLIDYCLDNKITKLPLWNCQTSEPHSRDLINSLLNNYLKNI